MGCAGSSPSREEDSPPEKPPPPKAASAPAAPKPEKPAAASGTSKRLSTLLGGQKVRSKETVEKLKEEKEELLVEDPTKARANAVTKFGPNVKKLRSSGFALRYACVSQRGYNPDDLYEANQDAYGVMDDFSKMYGVDASVVPDLLLGVFDGSGVEGEGCAQYLRREFGKQVVKSLDVFKTDFVVGYKDAMERLNQALIEDDGADASESGSTALTACFHGNLMHVCNVGDSRAVIGERRGTRIVAHPLSVDHTAYRKDERERIKAWNLEQWESAGRKGPRERSVIMSEFHADFEEPPDQQWHATLDKAEQLHRLGSHRRQSVTPPQQQGPTDVEDVQLGMDAVPLAAQIDDEALALADAPRLYQKGKRTPGLRITRSLGVDIWQQTLGVSWVGEVVRKELREQDQFLIIASDGLWEFMSNQEVCDRVAGFDDPLVAGKNILAHAYSLWLQFEEGATDDITMIVAYIDVSNADGTMTPAPRKPPADEKDEDVVEEVGNTPFGLRGIDVNDLMNANKPTKGSVTSDKRNELALKIQENEDDGAESEHKSPPEPKTSEELERIAAAVRSSFLFRKLPEEKANEIFQAMHKRVTSEGEVLFEQGTVGNTFYVLEEGEFAVGLQRAKQDAPSVIFTYETMHPHGANPCFGEQALMYPAKRPVTITCISEIGVLWEIDRATYRRLLSSAPGDSLRKLLMAVPIFESLTMPQLNRLIGVLSEDSFEPGTTVFREGDVADTFYVCEGGHARVTRSLKPGEEATGDVELGDPENSMFLVEVCRGEYFGERGLIFPEPRFATVTVIGDEPLKVLKVSKKDFDEVLGTLKDLIGQYSQWQYQMTANKELMSRAAGISRCRIEDFILEGICAQEHPFQFILANLGGRGFTIRCASKRRLHMVGLLARVNQEMECLAVASALKHVCPIPMTTFEDESYIYSVLPTRASLSLAALLEIKKGVLAEGPALFYAACAALALNHLHTEHAVYSGGLCYRNLSPDALIIDEMGYLQLVDFVYAARAHPAPSDYCGHAHYLSPEQVRGLGHSCASDYWGLGCLLYEMVTGTNPFLLGKDDSELAVFVRITSHQKGMLQLPDGCSFSAFLVVLLNELFEPSAEYRIGVREPQGFDEVRHHAAFERIDWEKLKQGTMSAPHAVLCKAHVTDLAARGAKHNNGEGFMREELLPEKPMFGQTMALAKLGDARALPKPQKSPKPDPDADTSTDRSFLHNVMDNLVQVSRRLVTSPGAPIKEDDNMRLQQEKDEETATTPPSPTPSSPSKSSLKRSSFSAEALAKPRNGSPMANRQNSLARIAPALGEDLLTEDVKKVEFSAAPANGAVVQNV